MTMFQEAVARVQERIDSAPVDEYLRVEASRDLTRLTEAYHLDFAEVQERTNEARQSEPDKWDRASWRREALAFALQGRETRANPDTIVETAKQFEAYLKGE